MKKLLIVAGIIIVPLFPILLVVSGVIGSKPKQASPVTLTYWTVENTAAELAPVISAYRRSHPYVTIHVAERPVETYREDLITAWAKGEGPDIFSLPQEQLFGFKDFITPLPATTRVAYYSTRHVLLRTDTVVTYQRDASLTADLIKRDFVDTVAKDVIANDGAILGLPLAMDSLAIYYNRDLLSSVSLAEPPKTWADFSALVPKLALADEQDTIVQAAAGIGLAQNVEHAADLAALLILQNGSAVVDSTNRQVLFNQAVGGEAAGSRAVEYYTDFASPGKEVYTWNAAQPDAREAFIQGKAALYFGTNADRATLEKERARLNFELAPMFHLSDAGLDNDVTTGRAKQINLARYWVETVAARAAHPDEAWSFIQFATKKGIVEAYLGASQQASALRTVAASQVADLTLGVFASQALTAQSWYRGLDAPVARTAMNDLLDGVGNRTADLATALDTAAKRIFVTLPTTR